VGLDLVDWLAIAIVIVAALGGLRRGLVLSAFSLVGLAGGAYAGSRLAPHVLHGGSSSAWTPLAGLIGAVVGAVLLQLAALTAGSFVRGGLRLKPLRLLDSAGGLVFGAALGVAIVWVGATVALRPSVQTELRREVQRSAIVKQLNDALPQSVPRTLLNLLGKIDPFPSITGPRAPSLPPGRGILRDPPVRTAATRVVKVIGTACGVGVEGTGWFARRDLVVTAAHVVAGEGATTVTIPSEPFPRPADVVLFDVHDDVAVLRVQGADQKPLRLADPRDGAAVAIIGYPLNGGLTWTAGRIGHTAPVLTQDALGHGPVARTITAVAGRVEHGDSGGPAVDAAGAVESMIFAARQDSASGYGVPPSIVRNDLAHARAHPVSTGSCVS
jgi:S1-C subfamily serine protease